jgi:hypothetical protein
MHVFGIYFPNGMREIDRIRGGPGIDKVLDDPPRTLGPGFVLTLQSGWILAILLTS